MSSLSFNGGYFRQNSGYREISVIFQVGDLPYHLETFDAAEHVCRPRVILITPSVFGNR